MTDKADKPPEPLNLDRLMRERPASAYAGRVARGEAPPDGPLFVAKPTEEARVTAAGQTLEQRLAEITEPLRTELAALDREIAERQTELAGLQEDRQHLTEILDRLDRPAPAEPPPAEAPPPAVNAGGLLRSFPDTPIDEDATEYVRAFIRNGGVDRNRIIPSHLYEAIVADAKAKGMRVAGNQGVKPGTYPGRPRILAALNAMHANGELAVKRKKSIGGGVVFYAK